MIRRLLVDLGVVLGLAVGWHLLFLALGGPEAVLAPHPTSRDRTLATGEVLLFAGAVVGALAVWMAPAPTPRARPLLPCEPAAWAGGHVVLVLATGLLVTGWSPFTDDEEAYLLQARALLSGEVALPAVLPPGATANPFVVHLDGGATWTGVYPWLAGAWTAPGVLLGWPNLLWIPLGGVMVWLLGRVARRSFGDGPARAAMAATALSPVLIGLGAFKHTALLATLGCVGLVDLLSDTRRGWRDVLAGVVVGGIVLARPVEGAVALVGAGVWVLLDPREEGAAKRVLRLVRIGAGGLPLAVGWAAYNAAITGHPLSMPYGLLFDGESVYGFGQTAYDVHTPSMGLSNAFTILSRLMGWALGWPLLVLAGLLVRWPPPRAAVAVLALVVTHVLVYLPAPFGQVPTVGVTYAVWLLPVFAVGLAHLVQRDGSEVAWRLGRVLLFGWTAVVPWLLVDLTQEVGLIAAPRQAAERLRAEHGRVLLLVPDPGFTEALDYIYVLHPPLARSPEDPVIWWAATPGEAEEARALAAHPDRAAFRVAFTEDQPPDIRVEVVRVAP